MPMIVRGIICLLAVLLTHPSEAEVVSAGDTGFVIQHQLEFSVGPKQVYQAIVDHVGQWWPSDHSWSGEAKNLYIEPRAGGCFCERLADGGSAFHMQIAYIKPGAEIRMTGGLGPLQMLGVHGGMRWLLNETDSGSSLSFKYQVSGYNPDGFTDLSKIVDGVLRLQLQGLEDFLAPD